MAKTAKRLYEQFQPEHYDLALAPDRTGKTFTGRVSIKGKKTGRPSKRLTFHQKGLKITKATVTRHDKQGDQDIAIERINTHERYYEVRLHSQAMLYPGSYTVIMEFQGKITDNMTGIYLSNFEHDGKKKQLVATQFESHHAREAFPCIDEPEAKATFGLTLTTDKDDVVLGNTPVKTEKSKGKQRVTCFETTPRMSTYLLAFVYGEMHAVEAKTKDGVLVRSWSSVAIDKTFSQYSVDEAVGVLEFFTDYFGVPYPLAKCDQVALPDFDAGAMENWGLITYREIALLADPNNRSVSSEQYISLVVAHELSHQWFGNLVTMKWWDDLWLNESFASLMEHLALDTIHPEWRQWEHYTASDVISTSSRDVYSDVQPVSVQVTDPDLIETLFDPGIVYAKGARLLKMLRDYIGDDDFKKGLRAYFKEHAYANATRADLWAALSKASGKDIDGLMTPWIVNAGMPVVTVKQTGKELQVSQKRFLLDDVKDDRTWPVPLLTDKPTDPLLFDTATAKVSLNSSEPAVVNAQGSGHYFVRYQGAKHRAFINEQVQARKLPAETRINILNDAYMLARKGESSLVDALEIVKDCGDEDRDSVWATFTRVIMATSQLTEGDAPSEAKIKELRRKLASHWFKELGWEDKPNDDSNTKQLRHTALAYMVSGEDKDALKQALSRYDQAKSLQDLPAELRSTILGAAVKHGPPEVVGRLLKAYPSELPDIQLDITAALGSTRDVKVAERVYAEAMGPKGFVRNQDVMRWLAIFIRNHHIRPFVWQFIQDNWDWIEKVLGDSKSFDYLPVYCAATFNSADWEKQFHDFFEPKRAIKTLERNILVGYADIAARVTWRQREEKQLQGWLAKL